MLSVILAENRCALFSATPGPQPPAGAPGSRLTAPGFCVTSRPIPCLQTPSPVTWYLILGNSLLVSWALERSGFQVPSLPFAQKLGRSC